jgi:hypothetical protein
MTSIVNLFSNFDDLTKPKSVTDGVTKYNTNNNTQLISLSLNQGNKFKKDQKKISDSLAIVKIQVSPGKISLFCEYLMI